MVLYRDIIKKAWQFAKTRKHLWFFGLFATFITTGTIYELLVKSLSADIASNPFSWIYGYLKYLTTNVSLSDFGSLFIDQPFILLITIMIWAMIICLLVFFIWICTISQIALVNNSANAYAGKPENFSQGLATGVEKFWPVFVLNALVKLLFYIGYFIMGLIFLLKAFDQSSVFGGLLYTIFFIFFVSIGLIFSFVVKYAVAYVVVDRAPLKEAIVSAWNLFIRNWLISIEMSFVLFFIDFLVSFIIILALAYIAFPLFLLALTMIAVKQFFSFWFLVILLIVLLVLIAVIPRAVLTVFQVYSWTDLFLVLKSKGAISKLIRMTAITKKT